MSKKTFVVIGAAGYIARKHVETIKALDGEVTAIIDPNDSVGYIDALYPAAKYYANPREYEQAAEVSAPDFFVVCTPNYSHYSLARWGLSSGSDVICEKPVVLDPASIQQLIKDEGRHGHRVYPIVQLRCLPGVQERAKFFGGIYDAPIHPHDRDQVQISYSTPRGDWYHKSWKGDPDKSGGLLMNIGVHLFDLMCWIYGPPLGYSITQPGAGPCAGHGTMLEGTVEFKIAHLRWHLSISQYFPAGRVITTPTGTIDVSNMGGLHRTAYESILRGEGFTLESTEPAIRLVSAMTEKVHHKLSVLPSITVTP